MIKHFEFVDPHYGHTISGEYDTETKVILINDIDTRTPQEQIGELLAKYQSEKN